MLFTYLHLAAERKLTEQLVETKTTAIAYETIQVGRRLPLLEPMSEIAGRMSSLVGANYLSKAQGGTGDSAERGSRSLTRKSSGPGWRDGRG